MNGELKGRLTAVTGKSDGDRGPFAVCTKGIDGGMTWTDFPMNDCFVDSHQFILAEISHLGISFGTKLPHLMSPAKELSVFVRVTNLVGLPYSDVQGVFKTCLHAMLACNVPAVFNPQAWVRDYAMDIDGKTTFNALPALLDLGFDQASELFKPGNDLDCLSESLKEREIHSGPFEVTMDEADLVTMVCLLSDAANSEAIRSGSMSDVTREMWNVFAPRAQALLQHDTSRVALEQTAQAVMPAADAEVKRARLRP